MHRPFQKLGVRFQGMQILEMRQDEQSQQVFNVQMGEEVYNSTGTNELDEVISRSSIAQVLPTYFKIN